MDNWRKTYSNELKRRIFSHWGATALGILVAVLSAGGNEMQKSQELADYGTIMVGVSSFLGAIGLILAKFKDIK